MQSLRRLTLLLAALAACDAAPPPPPAEFLLAAGDSTFWVRTDDRGVHLRGSPIILAAFDGRLYELYVTDDDRSYYDAVLIGQRVYRRDLLSGDSMLVYQDSVVPALARQWGMTHPDERPLAPDEAASEQPEMIASSEVEFLDVHGPYLSYEYHLDVEAADGDGDHATRRGVVDLRTGAPASLRALFGPAAADTLEQRGRRALSTVVDSILTTHGPAAERAARALDDFDFDRSSFALAVIDRAPAVAFLVPGVLASEGFALELPPVSLPGEPPAWWNEILLRLPTAASDSAIDRWTRPRYSVAVRYDGGAESATLALADSVGREWTAGPIPAPALRIIWLDAPAMDSTARQALGRAFDEAALYSGEARVAIAPDVPPSARFARAAPR